MIIERGIDGWLVFRTSLMLTKDIEIGFKEGLMFQSEQSYLDRLEELCNNLEVYYYVHGRMGGEGIYSIDKISIDPDDVEKVWGHVNSFTMLHIVPHSRLTWA